MRQRFFAWMACVAGLAFIACSDSASGDDDDTGGTGGSGDTGGTGGTGGTAGSSDTGGTGAVETGGSAGSVGGATVEEHCEAILDIYCDRSFNECRMMEGYEACLASAVPACCGSRCSEPSPASQAEVDDCSTNMQLMTCAQIMDAQLPESCAGILAAN